MIHKSYSPSLVYLSDVFGVALTWWAAYLVRFNFAIPPEFLPGLQLGLVVVVLLQGILLRVFGLYRSIWVFASLPDLVCIARTVAVATLLTPLVIVVAVRYAPEVPRLVFLIQPVLLALYMGGSRALYRIWKESRLYGGLRALGQPVIVLGAGDAAVGLVRELSRSAEWRVVGLLDDSPGRQGREVYGCKVLGRIADLERVAEDLKVGHAIIAMPNERHEVRRKVAGVCVRAGVKALIVPAIEDVMTGRVSVSEVRRVDVEDLLGRDPVRIHTAEVREYLRGKSVMVTGAGGSIGSELCRQIARFEPSVLVCFDISEFALYRLSEEFATHFPTVQLLALAGDVKDAVRVDEVITRYHPHAIFHAAAYKHVPLMEDENAWQAVRNNVLGTWQVARSAVACGVSRFVLVSTDKAVNPTNVMGATKRLAEQVCQALSSEGRTQFEIVRFGNVLGSAGSVIPKFQEQIASGGPVTVTHPDITRYFMSIPEAAQLVLQAGSMGQGGEIFVLDMGDPVKIADLARDMIRLSGHTEEQIRVVFTGLRPGEKLFEEVLADAEETRATHHPKLRIARAQSVEEGRLVELLNWLRQRRAVGGAEVRRELRRWVPEYAPAAPRPPLQVLSPAGQRAS
ncbi:MAG TPA: nucleoside-diphosphate sugar epimerase/dehydratase [Zoogloea sp.]|uniref:polysaccharide biosynthesis protein n=1 Tax=Zoogloea sp. TaxID=49181 RepID=UPI002C7D8980|nr:nucleoside-diphosphate sugar epimerase/dehydratase [Zoogloea sp.]HOB45774.1 nucleoside-diphosphate sugar epimerase/dehydratase [Zoogloea sp.]HQA10033.1 nucleoside-diphosphate sugar epimerase/dehydratase [Zoogloea sp.]HQE38660.1 nucleoside-diphosphate sugar epimerase/dehydratase [Zoogloea sp.]